MEKLLNVRLGKCKGQTSANVGFAAAGATAESGRLIDITKVYINTNTEEVKPFHEGYTSESVLSTTLPIMSACRSYHSVVYMTSRRFTYLGLCTSALARLRVGKANTTVIIEMGNGTYDITSQSGTNNLNEEGMLEVARQELSRPMSCAICDWDSVTAYDRASRDIEATMWWFPMKISSPLESVAPDHATSYFARAYGTSGGYNIIVGGYRRLHYARPEAAEYIGKRWNAYNALLQSQTCTDGECFSCSYLRSCLYAHAQTGKAGSTKELELLLDM